jgi:solute carrier family 13 (sodium-dependent dicarboxylate transporter), member 2/3/5
MGGDRKRGAMSDETDDDRPAVGVRPWVLLGCGVAALSGTAVLGADPDLSAAGQRALFILLFAILLWVTEAIPAFAVGLVVIGLNLSLLGAPHGVMDPATGSWEKFVGVLGHPLIWLFFGGFLLAAGMEKCGLDRRLAFSLLSHAGTGYRPVLFVMMLATFLLSMFMSNTATTAMMLAVMAPMLRDLPKDSSVARGLLLGIAAGANLGGLGTLIGTPPNAIAAAALTKLVPPHEISFLGWIVLGAPPAFVMLGLAWALLVWLFPAHGTRLLLRQDALLTNELSHSRSALWVVSACLVVTIGLWLTSQWHGLPTAAVAFVPIVVLTASGVLSAKDIRSQPFDVLFLMAGGLALGQAVTITGLSDWMIHQLPVDSVGPVGLVVLMAAVTVVLCNFMSHTAGANILVPLGVSLATGSEVLMAMGVAFGASSAMCLPVATPPNAMVFSTGRLRASDLLPVGLFVGVMMPGLGLAWVIFCLKTFPQLAQ